MAEKFYFITDRKDHQVKNHIVIRDIRVLRREFEREKTRSVGFDREFSSLDIILAQPLLSQFGFSNGNIYVVDDTSIDIAPVIEEFKDYLFIGHNIKIDYQMTKYHNNVEFRNIWDTMLVEQRLSLGSKRRNNLATTLERRMYVTMEKDTREEFAGMTSTSTFTDRQVTYAGRDVKYLHDLVEKQRASVVKWEMEYLMYSIEFPLCTILGDAELNGIILNEEKWKEVIKYNEDKQLLHETALDEILQNLLEETNAEQFIPEFYDLKPLFTKPRHRAKTYQPDMFDADPVIMKNYNTGHINYSSTQQVLRIFTTLSIPVPTFKEKDVNLGYKVEKNSIREDALEQYNIEYPENLLFDFIKKLIDYKEVTKALNSFGERFLHSRYAEGKKKKKIGYKNIVTGMIHTIYKQCMTVTGRLASGNEAIGKYNSQQIPKDERYRACFGVPPGYEVVTADLSGAELVIGASLSKDKRLLELTTGDDPDPHSPLAQASYNAIISYIITNMKRDRAELELTDLLKADRRLLKLSENEATELTKARVHEALTTGSFILTKETASDLRTYFKNVNYAMAYGASVDRIMEVLNVSKVYAQIVEKTLKKELPVFMKFLEDKAKLGLQRGYVYFNKRTNSKRWFPEVIEANKRRQELPFAQRGSIERYCKNSPIQGTQADMIKEATVKFFYEYLVPNKLIKEVKFLLFVHDEIVLQIPKGRRDIATELVGYMGKVASEYLDGVEMKADYKIKDTWTK